MGLGLLGAVGVGWEKEALCSGSFFFQPWGSWAPPPSQAALADFTVIRGTPRRVWHQSLVPTPDARRLSSYWTLPRTYICGSDPLGTTR